VRAVAKEPAAFAEGTQEPAMWNPTVEPVKV